MDLGFQFKRVDQTWAPPSGPFLLLTIAGDLSRITWRLAAVSPDDVPPIRTGKWLPLDQARAQALATAPLVCGLPIPYQIRTAEN